MLIVAIAWMYVVLLMAMTQETVLAGIGTVLGYGLLPLSIVLYLMATPARRRRNARRQQAQATQPGAGGATPDASTLPVGSATGQVDLDADLTTSQPAGKPLP